MSTISLKQIQDLIKNFEMESFGKTQDFLKSICLKKTKNIADNKSIVIINGGVATGKSTIAYNLFKQVILDNFFYISNDSVYYKMFHSDHSFEINYDKAREFTNKKLNESILAGKSFVLETVLSKDIKRVFVEKCLSLGYTLTNIHVYTDNLSKAYERSNYRVEQGNHFVSFPFMEDRQRKSRESLEWLIPACETNIIVNNTNTPTIEWYRSSTEEFRSADEIPWIKKLQSS